MKLKSKIVFLLLNIFVLLYSIHHISRYLINEYAFQFNCLKLQYLGVQSYCPTEVMLPIKTQPAAYDSNHTWNQVISDYTHSKHTGYAVYTPMPDAGLCNRMLNSVSVLLFAMATNRALYIDWKSVDSYTMHMEQMGHSDFASLFQSNLMGQAPPANASTFHTFVDDCTAFKMRFGDPRQLTHEVVSLNTGDFWGSLLMLNPLFKYKTFHGLGINEGFPLLFQAIFKPHMPVKTKKCSWFFQYRYNWPESYSTSSFDNFIQCAAAHGFTKDHYGTSYIITDNPAQLISGASMQTKRILKKMHFMEKKIPCRGSCGDNSTIQHMYALSTCQHAVLTASSSFGVCIAGLANTQTVLKVNSYGQCYSPKHKLLDPNALVNYGGGRAVLHEF